MRRSCWRTSAGVWQTGVATSSTDCMSSELIRGSSSWPATAASTVSMCWTRSNVSASRSMYSSSTPSVYGSLWPNAWSSTLPPGGKLEPLPVIEGGMSESVMGTISPLFAGSKASVAWTCPLRHVRASTAGLAMRQYRGVEALRHIDGWDASIAAAGVGCATASSRRTARSTRPAVGVGDEAA